ncbi:hypothetical protein [Granulicella sp. S190]|uniref:hypothetical protein n=1 Tax=Granulicella sp. S190 TaxID=1747226 RepID=UPI00131C6A5B|nr:hypothetical protein [Granulicella sp. S190]
MRLTHHLAVCCLALATLTASAQQPSAATISPSADSATPHTWTNEQILTCTVSDCWQLAGKNEATFFDIVQQLAGISAQTRGLTLPESAEAGKRAGEYIKAKAKADHGQLLYAIVDASVRKVGTKSPTN